MSDAFLFRLSEDCQAYVWPDLTGWYGELHWSDGRETNPVGPYTNRQVAIDSITAEFVMLEHAIDE